MQNYSSAEFDKTTKFVAKRRTHPIARKRKPSPPAQLNKAADPVTGKAKAAIAAMMENPASAKFGKIKRAVKTLRGERLDTMCGHVKGKHALGKGVGEMPFLYIVDHNEAYLVDGGNLTAETVYRVLCD